MNLDELKLEVYNDLKIDNEHLDTNQPIMDSSIIL